MKYGLLIVLSLIVINCKDKDGKTTCSFRTVEDLDKADFVKCPPSPPGDSTYIWMRYYSGGYNNNRKIKGIPSLPGNYTAEVFSVDNQVRWHGDIDEEGRFLEIGKPYLKWKTLEWDKDTLKYDFSLFIEGKNDRWGKTLSITYYLDTPGSRKDYLFRYEYSPGQNYEDILMNKSQADSVLKAWKINY